MGESWLLVIGLVHCYSSSILFVSFLGHPVLSSKESLKVKTFQNVGHGGATKGTK